MLRLAIVEAIRSGTTLVMEVGAQLAGYADLLGETGLRCVLAEQVTDRPPGSVVGDAARLTFDLTRSR